MVSAVILMMVVASGADRICATVVGVAAADGDNDNDDTDDCSGN